MLATPHRVRLPDAFRFLWDEKADDGGRVVYRCAHGGRGSAKSKSFAMALVLKGSKRKLKILCAREIQASIKESSKAEIEDAIEAAGLSWFYTITDMEIRGRNGTLIIFAGLRHNPYSIKSMANVDICWVEEANTVSLASLTLLDATIRKAGSEIWFTWNPKDATDPVDAMFRGDLPQPGAIVRQVNYEDNPWFGETTLLAKMERDRERDPDKYAHVWRGGYQRNSEARVFRNWRVQPFETPADAILRFGADWGFAVDPTVLIRMFIGHLVDGVAVADVNGKTLFIDHEAYKVGCEIDETPALFAGNCPSDATLDGRPAWTNPKGHPGVPGALAWLITADSARPETVSFMKRRRFKIVPAIKGAGSIEDGIEFLKTFDIVIHPRCKNTQDEFTAYSWKTDPLTGEILPVLADKDNNLIDAARYACEGVRRAKAGRKPPEGRKKPKDYRGDQRGEGGEWMAA